MYAVIYKRPKGRWQAYVKLSRYKYSADLKVNELRAVGFEAFCHFIDFDEMSWMRTK